MRVAALWTKVMAIGIAAYGCALVAALAGGGLLAWAFAVPGMFVGLQLFGLPVVLACEVAERAGLIRAPWRQAVHEWLVVGALLGAGWLWLSAGSMVVWSGLFAVMFLLRLMLGRHWRPGEPLELAP